MRRQPEPNNNKLELALKERRNTLRKYKKVYPSLWKIFQKPTSLFTASLKKTFFFLFFLCLLWKQEQIPKSKQPFVVKHMSVNEVEFIILNSLSVVVHVGEMCP